MRNRRGIAATLAGVALVVASALACGLAGEAHAAGDRRGPSVVVSTVRDAGAAKLSVDAKKLDDLECQAERATAEAKLAKRLAACLRRDASGASGFDLRACEDASFRKFHEATFGLSCPGTSDVVGTYSCHGVLCSCHGEDCGEMFEASVCGDAVRCEMFGDEAVCSCLPPL